MEKNVYGPIRNVDPFVSVQLALKVEGGSGELEEDPPDDRLQGRPDFRRRPQQPVATPGKQLDQLSDIWSNDIWSNDVQSSSMFLCDVWSR